METIRAITADDAAQYYEIRLRALREHPEAFGASAETFAQNTLEQVADRLRSNRPESFSIFGAFVDGELAGLSAFGCPVDNPKMCHRGGIYQMYVAPEQRGRKLGQKLLAAAVVHARQFEYVEELMLGVTVGNEAARSTYLNAGFQTAYIDPRSQKIDGVYYDTEFMILIL